MSVKARQQAGIRATIRVWGSASFALTYALEVSMSHYTTLGHRLLKLTPLRRGAEVFAKGCVATVNSDVTFWFLTHCLFRSFSSFRAKGLG